MEKQRGLQNEATPEAASGEASLAPEGREPADDMSVVLSLVGHIENPCADDRGNNLREFWVKVAKELLKTGTLENQSAKEVLEEAVKKYSEK